MAEVLGKYHLVEPLGGGPTGEVFRAKVYGLAGFERQFAVKRFHPALVQDPAAAEILAAAARAYGGLSHPRVAAMHEFGGTFMAVELVEGLDLARLLAVTSGAGEPMPLGARLAVLSQIARVLAYAHGRGVPHLGICPTNALVTPEGDVKICDFGILRARLRGRPADDATLAGRLPYLAPEQVAAAPGTPMTDVFALATLGYELVTGDRAFAGKTGAEIAARVAVGAPRPADAPDAVAEVLRRAFLVRPDDRFPDAGAFADALDGALRRASLPGGRADVAAAVRRALARAAELQSQGISGAVSFPLPAPPASLPGTPLTDVFPDGQVPTTPVPKTLLGVPPPPLPPPAPAPLPEPPVEADIPELPDMPEIVMVEEEPSPPPLPKRPTVPPPIPREAHVHAPEDMTPTTAWKPTPPPRAGRRVLLIAGLILALGIASVVAIDQMSQSGDVATRPQDGGPVALVVAPASADAPAVAVAAPAPPPPPAPAETDAAPVAVAAPAPPPPAPPEPGGKLVVTSSPAGAFVYLDGADKGTTPVDLPPSEDRHKLALLMPGHKLYKADVPGGGRVEARLDAVAAPKGPAGIKVVCKSRNRFYVVVDGVDTGMLCPTGRIGVTLGAHTVEVYDAVNDATQAHSVEVRGTHNSLRVKVEE